MPKPARQNQPAPSDIHVEKKPGVTTDKHARTHHLEPAQTERRQDKPEAKEAEGLAETDPRRVESGKPS